MSGKAFGWAREQVCSGGIVAKAVLLLMADYAREAKGDARRRHESFPSVATMALELCAHERTIQRAIRSLEDDALIERQAEATAGGKTTSNRYLLAIDIAAEPRRSATPRDGAAPPSPPAERHPPPGAAPPSTTFEPLKGTVESADALSSARAPGATDSEGDSRSGRRRDRDEHPPGERSEACGGATDEATERWRASVEAETAFNQVELVWGQTDPDRVAPPVDRRAWLKAVQRIEPERLKRAALRYLAESADVRRGRCKALAVWLAEERWTAWLGDPPATPEPAAPAPSFDGPADLVAAIAAAKDVAWRGSWLSPCRWDGEARAIVARTGFAADTLARELAAVLARFDVKVTVQAREHAA